MKTLIYLSFVSTLILFAGCGESEDQADVHEMPAPAYATVDVSNMELGELKAHLRVLQTEIVRSTQTQAFGEMHYQEVTLTATLERLSTQLPETNKTQAENLITAIKPLSIKLHIAGHDQSSTIAKNIGAKLSTQIDQLLTLLP